MLKFVLLGFLAYRPMSGYDLESWMSVSTSNFWYAQLSQIYATLKSMEEHALVTSQVQPQEARPDRRVYSITDKGRAELQDWLNVPSLDMPVKKDMLLIKVFFGLFADKNALLTQMRLLLDTHKKQKAQYQNETPQAMLKFLADQPEIADHALLWEMTRRYGELYEDTYIRWLEETIQMIERRSTETAQKR